MAALGMKGQAPRRIRANRHALLNIRPDKPIKHFTAYEFKSVFEVECQARGLELFVLPPKRPDLNGCVERAQSTLAL